MSNTNPNKLGIIACPGGEAFADLVIRRLGAIYRRRFFKKVESIASRYGMAQDEVIKHINFNYDIGIDNYSSFPNVSEYHPPHFRVHTKHSYFANGEVKTEIIDSVRGKDIYIFQDCENHLPLSFNANKDDVQHVLSVNDHLMSLYVTIDAVAQAGAKTINLVLPVFPYARQHKKKGREGLTAARVSQHFESLGVSRIITLDIHTREIENAFDGMRLENLHAAMQIIERLISITDVAGEDLVVLAPDTGAVDRNKFYASALHRPLNLLYKERDYTKVTKNATDSNILDVRLLGDVKDKTVFMADDMIGTGGTLLKGMRTIRDMGARKIICAVSLPLFSGSAIADFDRAYQEGLFYRIIGTNAISHKELLTREWYSQVDVTELFAQIISLLFHNRSLSALLDNRDLVAKKIARQFSKKAEDLFSMNDDSNEKK